MLRDVQYAFRMLRNNPGFAAVAVCSLAIGIGANSAIYSIADGFILRPLPIIQPSRVVKINPVSSGMFGASSSVSYPDYIDLRDQNRTFSGLVATSYASFGFAAQREAQPRMKFGMFASGNMFRVLGVTPSLGRGFREDEDRVPGRDAVVVLGHDLWVSDFESNPAVLGQKIWLNGIELTIVGVGPESFSGMDQLKPALFVPLAMSSRLANPENLTKRSLGWLDLRGRLKPGTGIAQAQADLNSIAAVLRQSYPKTDENLKLKVETEFQARVEQSPPDVALLIMLGTLAVCVLLVACANVAGLLLSRSTARQREISVRLAMGASRGILLRQLLIENLLLALMGSAAGLVIAELGVRLFQTLQIPTDIPVVFDFRLDQRALLFTFVIAILSTFVFGLMPALRSSRMDLIQSLKERDATASRTSRLWGRNILVSGQIALALVLLIVSGVMLRGFQAQLAQGPGFRIDGLQLMRFDPTLVHYNDSQRDLYYKQLLEQARMTPDVISATLTSSIPMSPGNLGMIAVVPDGQTLKRGEPPPHVFDSVVTPGYFETMDIPVQQGRAFLESDKLNTPLVAVVNPEFARHYWPGQSPIGKRIHLNDPAGKLVQVVGVARMSKYLWITEAPADFLYLPFAQNPQSDMSLVAQSKNGDAATLVPALRGVVASLDRNMPIYDVRTMRSLYESRAVATPNIITRTVGGMGVMGLILSVIGLYGVISYSVSRRTREFGIRMAVGADRHKVVKMVLRQGLWLAAAGIFVGLVSGIFVAQAIRSQMLFSFGHIGVIPYIAVALLLLVTTAAASYVPARRASLTDPMRALREE
ncbi:MAG TPA: ABC transporter permease [Bryobacteraceae bacterium]|nr:ABC transporter permease [Bryobacteraceae bacterium]